jgi:Erv1 / Alr family
MTATRRNNQARQHKKTQRAQQSNKETFYTKEDYESNNGMMTSIWGPPTWHLLHCISFNYPVNPSQEQKEQYHKFIMDLQHVLPCGKCRKNLSKNFKKVPLRDQDLESRDTFSKYIFKLHEVVNTMLGKTSGLTYETVRDRYEHFRARCNQMKAGASNTKKELGCTVPFYGKKKKCIMRIVDHEQKCKTFL